MKPQRKGEPIKSMGSPFLDKLPNHCFYCVVCNIVISRPYYADHAPAGCPRQIAEQNAKRIPVPQSRWGTRLYSTGVFCRQKRMAGKSSTSTRTQRARRRGLRPHRPLASRGGSAARSNRKRRNWGGKTRCVRVGTAQSCYWIGWKPGHPPWTAHWKKNSNLPAWST